MFVKYLTGAVYLYKSSVEQMHVCEPTDSLCSCSDATGVSPLPHVISMPLYTIKSPRHLLSRLLYISLSFQLDISFNT